MQHRRVDVEAFTEHIESLTDEQRNRQAEEDAARAEAEHSDFVSHYKNGICYLCGKPFRTLSKSTPCVHWLLRLCKFKKKDFPLIYEKFGYFQIAAFARWCANQEHFMRNINDLAQEKSERKVFEYTVKWKNIEWTFDCSKNDYQGHPGKFSDHPHYHFQMRIDKRPFIDFGDFHIPFSEEDLFQLDLSLVAPDHFYHWFGEGGVGMQMAAESPPEYILENSIVSDDEQNAVFRMQTTIYGNGEPIDMEALIAAFNESKATGETVASLARKHLKGANVTTIISPAETIPDIAKRTERERR